MPGPESKEPKEPKESLDDKSEIKVLVVGDLGVGKSTLISRFIGESYQESIPKFESKSRKVTKDGKTVRAVIFDSREEERFRTLSSSLYKNAKAIFFVFALDNVSTFENIPKWVEEANRFCTERKYVGYIVGTKSDIVDQEEGGDEESEEEPGKVARVDVEKKGKQTPVDEKEVKSYAKTVGMTYMRVTATDFTALKLFNSMMDDVWIRFIDPNAKKTSKKEGGCCIAM